jgi:hypothetical protein
MLHELESPQIVLDRVPVPALRLARPDQEAPGRRAAVVISCATAAGCAIATGAMRVVPVGNFAPRLDENLSLLDGSKPVLIQAVLPQAAVERLDTGIIRRFTWAAELQCNALGVRPGVQRFRDELWTIVDGDPCRYADGPLQLLKNRHDPLPSARAIAFDRRTNSTNVIDEREDSEPLAIRQRIGDNIHAPPLIGPFGRIGDDAGRTGPFPSTPPPEGQSFHPVPAVDPLMVDRPSLPAHQYVHAAIPRADAGSGEIPQAHPLGSLILCLPAGPVR